MNREIRFRAWVKSKKEMFLSPREISFLGSWFDAHLPGAIAAIGNVVIMQWTGMVDCKGREIYEGDIIRINIGGDYSFYDSVVTYYVDGFKLNSLANKRIKNYLNQEIINTPKKCNYSDWLKSEVIGNIYENEELLTTK